MILTIDIGNSHIMLGLFRGETLAVTAKLSTDKRLTEDEYADKLRGILDLHKIDPRAITGAIVASVVPTLNATCRLAVTLLCGVTPLFVGPGIKTGLNLRCDDPASVGADLICAAVAAHRRYGSPCLIADLGTATKLIALDPAGAFLGVSIMPGVLMGLEALAGGAAQLPMVSLDPPPAAIGKNTADCMRSGLLLGHAAMLDGMIDRFRAERGEALPVYATGGLAPLILPHCRHEITLNEHLILEGLCFLYRKNQ